MNRCVQLFEERLLRDKLGTDLKDHKKVLKYNEFSFCYEILPKFDNGRADAIVLRDQANEMLSNWFTAFAASNEIKRDKQG